MKLRKLKDDLYVPTDFGKFHHYYADENGEREYSGITSVLAVLAKPALIQWASNENTKYVKENGLSLDTLLRTIEPFKSTQLPFPDSLARGFVVNDELLEEARTAHARKKDKAAEHGTDAHALVEEYIKACMAFGGSPEKRAQASEFEGKDFDEIGPFKSWSRENVDHFLFSERRMSNRELWLAGTADFAYIGKDGKRYVADFKTSSGIYGMDYWLQVAAYRLLAEAEGDAPYDGATIVRLGKKGATDFEVQYLYDYETMRDAFLACLTIYRAQAALKGLSVH